MKRCAFLLLCLWRTTLAADPVAPGRLFFTPAERATLVSSKPIEKPILHGSVQRSLGPGTIWIDGQAQPMPTEISATEKVGGELLQGGQIVIHKPGKTTR